MLERWFSGALVVTVALWCGLVIAAPALVVEPPQPDCAVICFETETIIVYPFPEPVFEPEVVHETLLPPVVVEERYP
jgi:hypothetical protein